MLNKITILFFAFATLQLNAQSTSKSPFSSYGLGERGGFENASFTGLGNCSATYFDSTVVNYFNPSTYNTYGTGQPLFSIGVNSKMSWYNQGDVTSMTANAMIDHFVMGIPIKKHFGIAFGLKPFASRGYSVYDRVKVGTDSLKYSYLGTGGAHQAFIGLSSNIIKFKSTTLSVGANVGYIFGNSTNERRSQLIQSSSSAGGVDYNTIRFSSLFYELGGYLRHDFNDNHSLIIATILEPSQQLSAKKDEFLYYSTSNVENPNTYETLYDSLGQTGKFTLAPSYTFGFNYILHTSDEKKGNNIRNSEWSLHFNFNSTDWSKFRSDFDATSNLLSTTRISFGLQYTPEYKFFENSATSNFFEKTRYRVGYYMNTLPYAIDGSQLKDQGATFGIGLPIMAQQSLSSVNFGFSFGQRTSGGAASLNEKYIGFNFGITMAPSFYDRWFRKRKLD